MLFRIEFTAKFWKKGEGFEYILKHPSVRNGWQTHHAIKYNETGTNAILINHMTLKNEAYIQQIHSMFVWISSTQSTCNLWHKFWQVGAVHCELYNYTTVNYESWGQADIKEQEATRQTVALPHVGLVLSKIDTGK